MLRQPIVVVMGHVDHGKTSLLDAIRQSGVAKREFGGITQHVGASEVPLEVVKNVCGPMLDRMNTEFTIPGLLFIDTPGHEAFTNLRKRGGSVADIAILVIDVTKGIEAQTIEAIEILKEYKTPFVIALNKVDALSGWNSKASACVSDSLPLQRQDVLNALDEKAYALIGKLYEFGFQAERFDRVNDFTKQVLIIPCSAKTREGLPELLMFVAGLAQRFLKQRLELHEGIAGKGSILEVREEEGLGKTLDVILYDGKISGNDEIVFATDEGPKVSKVKALLKPKPLDEMRDPRQKFSSVESVTAASGVKIACDYADVAIAGSSLVVVEEGNEKQAVEYIGQELRELVMENESEGVILRADTLGSLEAITRLFAAEKIAVKSASIGNVFRKQIFQAASVREKEKFLGVVFAFNVEVDESAKSEAENEGVKIFEEKIIYNLIEGYKQWRDGEKAREKREAFSKVCFPAKILLLPNSCFRVSNPAVFGVEVLEGRIRKDQAFINGQGQDVGVIRAIQHEKEEIDEAKKGQQVAISMPEPFYGRQIKANETLYADCSKNDIKTLETKYSSSLSEDEKALLKEIRKLKGFTVF